MLTIRETPDTNIVEFTIDGAVSAAEFDRIIATLTDAIHRFGKINVLKHVHTVGMVPISRLWEDLRFAFKHFRDIRRLAVVADQRWIEIVSMPSSALLPLELKVFKESDIEAARAWLREP